MSSLTLDGETRIIALHVGSEKVFYIQEDIARYHSTEINEYIMKEHPKDPESANLVPVYLEDSPQIESFEESMIIFIHFIHFIQHNDLKQDDDEFWLTYFPMPDSSLLVDAWILGAALGAEWFQYSIFRALAAEEFDVGPQLLSKVWSVAPDGDKAGLPNLLMHKFMGNLERMSHNDLINLMSHYGNVAFMAKVFVSLVNKLKAAKLKINVLEIREMILSSSTAHLPEA